MIRLDPIKYDCNIMTVGDNIRNYIHNDSPIRMNLRLNGEGSHFLGDYKIDYERYYDKERHKNLYRTIVSVTNALDFDKRFDSFLKSSSNINNTSEDNVFLDIQFVVEPSNRAYLTIITTISDIIFETTNKEIEYVVIARKDMKQHFNKFAMACKDAEEDAKYVI